MRLIDWTPRIDRYRERLVRKRIIPFPAFGPRECWKDCKEKEYLEE